VGGAAAGGLGGAAGGLGGAAGGLGGAAAPAPAPAPQAGGSINKPHKQNRLRSVKKYKQEYKQSIREIRKTKKRIMKYFNNII
jgi:hypothetical protein